MIAEARITNQAGRAFDSVAGAYDDLFTRTVIGRAQRDAVWREAVRVFRPGSHILELNCGTGEDALYLAREGHRVLALDASGEMIAQAERRKRFESPDSPIEFHQLPTEHIGSLPTERFDGVFSNFSGLNCVTDLHAVAMQLAIRTATGAPALFCMYTRFCMWELAWYLCTGEFRKAFRRWSGYTKAHLNGESVDVHYLTVSEIECAFAPYFRLCESVGIGVFVPPSYLEPWGRRHGKVVALLSAMDRWVCKLPVFRHIGDHVVLHFVRDTESNA